MPFDLGGLISAGLGYLGSQDTNSTNYDIAMANNATQLDIAKNGMQYKVADLKKAGLNPALAYNSGPINMPNLSTPIMQNSAQAASDAYNSYLARDKIKADTAVSESQTAVNEAQAAKISAETRLAATTATSAEMDLTNKSLYSNDVSAAYVSDLIAKQHEAAMRSTYAQSDNRTRQFLDNSAKDAGFDTFAQAVQDADFRAKMVRNTILRNAVPETSAMANFWSTPYGRNVAPYVNSAKGMTDIGSTLIGTLK